MNEPEILDPYCNPDSPVVITFDEITSAAYRIKSGIKFTECTKSEHLTNLTGMEIYVKKEFLQATGSFKERGARYCMMKMSPQIRSRGIVAASAGNHAQACCYHGLMLGIPVTVVMPVTAPIMKIEKCKKYKGNVLVQGKTLSESKKIAMAYARDHGMMYLNGYDHPEVLAGQGTIGLEIWEQVPGLQAVIIPVGGGGLLAGIAVAIKALDPDIKVIGVEAERAPSLTEALKIGTPVDVKLESTLADGIAVAKIGVNAFASVKNILDKCVKVEEQYIALAILRLVEYEKSVVEGAGASPLAAILQGLVPELIGKRVCLILSGGNIDTTVLGRVLDRGLAADGRLVKVKVCISDRVGGIEDLSNTIGSLGVHIKDIVHERAWVVEDVFKVEVKVICECRDRENSLSLRETLATKYGSIYFNGQLYTGDDIARPTAIFAGSPPQPQQMQQIPSEIGQESIQQNVTDFEVASKKGDVSAEPSNASAQIGVGYIGPPQQAAASFPTPKVGGYSPYLQPDAPHPPQAQEPQQPADQVPSTIGGHTPQAVVGSEVPSQVATAQYPQGGQYPPMTDPNIPQAGSQIVSNHLPQNPSNVSSMAASKIPQPESQIVSNHPSQNPSNVSSMAASKTPHAGSQIVSNHPSQYPSNVPSNAASKIPQAVSQIVSNHPSQNPSNVSSNAASKIPQAGSQIVSNHPSQNPSNVPSMAASKTPQAGSQIVSNHPSQYPSNVPSMAGSKIPQAGSQIVSDRPSQQAATQVDQYHPNVPPLGEQRVSQVGTQIGSIHPSQSAKNDIGLMKPLSNCACKKRGAPGDY